MKPCALSSLAALLVLVGLPGSAGAQSGTQGASEYIVKEGDTLGGIANRSGVAARAIIEANGLKEPYHVRIGQRLTIPRRAQAANMARASQPAGTIHVVREGETLGGIANRTGVPARAIIDANGLKEPYHVRIGQRLTIPAAGPTAGSAPSRPAASVPAPVTPARSAAETAGGNFVHVVQEGETLGGVANRTGVAARTIIEANNLAEPYHLRTGQRLTIPGTRVHLVAEGDTGFGLAYEYGVPFRAIAEANNLDENATLRTGQRLIIPDAGRPAPGAQAAATPPPVPSASTASSSRFRWPLAGPIREGFNSGQGGQGHNGVDISASEGTPVRASADGIVIYAQHEKHRFGNLVILDHGNRWHTAYGHLSRINVRKGETVTAGAAIGLVGTTGLTTEPGLHFEVRHRNQPLDPSTVLGPQP